MEFLYGICSGIMLAASFFSLIVPSIEYSRSSKLNPLIPVLVGFILGIVFIKLTELIIPENISCLEINSGNVQYIETENTQQEVELEDLENEIQIEQQALPNRSNRIPKNLLVLVIAVTLHNIPEGLVIGFGYGASSSENSDYKLSDALLLTIAISLQNIPEGLALSIPLYKSGMSKFRSFLIAQASGLVEIIAALIGVSFVVAVKSLLPYALSFAAGAMVYVVFTDLLPMSYKDSEKWGKRGSIVGFIIMMTLDIGFG